MLCILTVLCVCLCVRVCVRVCACVCAAVLDVAGAGANQTNIPLKKNKKGSQLMPGSADVRDSVPEWSR